VKHTVIIQAEVAKKDVIDDIDNVRVIYFTARYNPKWRENISEIAKNVEGKSFVFCSIQVAKFIQSNVPELASGLIISNRHPEPQIGMNSIFDWNHYSTIIPSDLILNGHGVIHRFGDLDKPWVELPNDMFVKPISAWKPFTGFSCKKKDIRFEVNALTQTEHVAPHELVVVFPSQKIEAEYRYWIVDSTIVTSSSYGWDDEHQYHKPDGKMDKFVEKVIQYLDINGLTEYVIDIALVSENQYKVVELNAMSTSGWYGAMDEVKLIKSIAELVYV
jgi:hypothetical protein